MPRKIQSKTIRAFILFLFCPWLVFAVPDGEDRIGYTAYFFEDSGSNQVMTTSFSLAKRLIGRTILLLDIELDKVIIPPIDGSTGATRPTRRSNERFEKNRGQVIAGIEQGLGSNTSIALNVYRSQEIDYLSNAAIVTLSQDLFQKNTTLTLRAQYNEDRVGEILDNGDISNRDKTSYTAMFSISQTLSPTTLLELTADGVRLDGFLGDPYRKVQVFDANNAFTLEPEVHPQSRERYAGSLRLSQYIEPMQASTIAFYRYYFDDWEVKSHTVEGRINTYVLQDLIAGFSYRYYTQSAAEFSSERYHTADIVPGAFYSADYKLRSFDSNTFGISLSLLLRALGRDNPKWAFLEDASFELRYLRYSNSLDFTADIFQGSLSLGI